ncbi:hypothetical protein B7L51_019965 [Pectobacterium brasiliense]|uniref:hypothetical protein n=1 Tax=Pectobacterium brasiliense TaxID=180957 RepID=UPI000B974F4A|nr:hypothetical protein [Pectobacterium carotovorum]OYN49554.1 hypothetical protein B7L51_20030 [Pectobacterium carotovorum]
MEYRKNLDKIKMEARSESMTKWIGRIEEETDLVTEGGTPTEKMEDLIVKLKRAIDSGCNYNESINQLIQSAFDQGIQSGFAMALSKFSNGSIITRKKANENIWVLYSHSSQYQITEKLPVADGGNQKKTVKIKLSKHGFE